MVEAMHQGIYVRNGNLAGRKFEVAKEELMGMFGSRRTKIGVSQRPPRVQSQILWGPVRCRVMACPIGFVGIELGSL